MATATKTIPPAARVKISDSDYMENPRKHYDGLGSLVGLETDHDDSHQGEKWGHITQGKQYNAVKRRWRS